MAQAPDSCEETINTILMKPPQKERSLVGAEELPPMEAVPSFSQGYMVMEAQ